MSSFPNDMGHRKRMRDREGKEGGKEREKKRKHITSPRKNDGVVSGL